MKIRYEMNQPVYAMMSRKYQTYLYGQKGIINFYMFRVEKLEQYSDVLVFPDGVIDLIFVENPSGDRNCFLYGTPLNTQGLSKIVSQGNGDIVFGIRFLPDVIPHLLSMSARESIDVVEKITDITAFQSLADGIFARDSFEERVKFFLNKYLVSCYDAYEQKLQENRLAEYMLDRIVESSGTIKMNELSEEACYTTRYMDKIFHATYGISPKYYSRIVRFQSVLKELMSSKKVIDISEDVDLNEANLIREFKKMSGYTPRQFRRILDEYQKCIQICKM